VERDDRGTVNWKMKGAVFILFFPKLSSHFQFIRSNWLIITLLSGFAEI